jgi:hypothetical protein
LSDQLPAAASKDLWYEFLLSALVVLGQEVEFQLSIKRNADHYSLAARDSARAGYPSNRLGAGRWRSLAIDKPFSDRRGASGDSPRADGDPLRLRPLNFQRPIRDAHVEQHECKNL